MIKELLIALGVAVIGVLLLAGICHAVYVIIRRFFNYPFFSLKYGLLRRKFKEDDVRLCYDNLDNSSEEFKKKLLLKGHKHNRVNELCYIHAKILKKIQKNRLKGGDFENE